MSEKPFLGKVNKFQGSLKKMKRARIKNLRGGRFAPPQQLIGLKLFLAINNILSQIRFKSTSNFEIAFLKQFTWIFSMISY